MCLAIPARVRSIQGSIAEVEVEGVVTTADLSVLPAREIGDYVLVHAGLRYRSTTKRMPGQPRTDPRTVPDRFKPWIVSPLMIPQPHMRSLKL